MRLFHSWKAVLRGFSSLTGVGGNLAAIQASRLSTFYHQHYSLGTLRETLSSHFSFKRAFLSDRKSFCRLRFFFK